MPEPTTVSTPAPDGSAGAVTGTHARAMRVTAGSLGYHHAVCAECGVSWPCVEFVKDACARLYLAHGLGCDCGWHEENVVQDPGPSAKRTFKVRLAEQPTRIVLALHESGSLTWDAIRTGCDATSADMNLLLKLDFITSVTRADGNLWMLTPTGRAAVKTGGDDA